MDKLISVEALKDWIVGWQNAKQYNHPLNWRRESIPIKDFKDIMEQMPDEKEIHENCTVNLQTTANKENELSDIDTSKLHYVKVPENHIVIDFDLKDENGNSESGIHILLETKKESGIDVGMVKRTIDLITSLDEYNSRR